MRYILILLFLNSLVFSDTASHPYDPNTDLVVFDHSELQVCRPSYDPYLELIDGYPNNILRLYKNEEDTALCYQDGLVLNKRYTQNFYYYLSDYECPEGQTIINGTCQEPPECTTGFHFSYETKSCEEDTPEPPECTLTASDCSGNKVFNASNCSCECTLTASDCQSYEIFNASNCSCEVDPCNKDTPLWDFYDCDKDDVKNGDDIDYNRDGQTDIQQEFDNPPEDDGNGGDSYNCNYGTSIINLNKPQGGNWFYVENVNTEMDCTLLVNPSAGITAASFVMPDSLNCNNGLCYIQMDSNNNEDTDGDGQSGSDTNNGDSDIIDSNSTANIDLQPLLQSQENTNKHLKDLKDKTDITNNNLQDLKNLANDQLNSLASADGKLSDLKNLAQTSNNLLNAGLVNIGQGVGTTNNKLDGLAVGLGGVNDKLTTNNDLLTNIDNTQTESKDLLQELRDYFIDGDSNSTNSDLSFLSDEMGSILNRYSIDLYSGGCGSISTISTSLHGSNLEFFSQSSVDRLPVSAMRSVVIFIFTISGLILAFRGN